MSNFNSDQQSGFSLIEVMVAFFVLTFGLIAIVSSFPYGLRVNKESENISALVYASQSKLEQMLSTPYSSIATGTVEARHRLSNDPGSEYYQFERQTTVLLVDENSIPTAIDKGLKKITVTIFYNDGLSRQGQVFSDNVLAVKH